MRYIFFIVQITIFVHVFFFQKFDKAQFLALKMSTFCWTQRSYICLKNFISDLSRIK